MSKLKMMSLLAMVVVAMLLFSGITFASGNATPPAEGNSVRITIGDETMTNVEEGDTVHDGEERASSDDGEDRDSTEPACNTPSVRIRFSGDVSKVTVGLKEGTCDLIVKELVMNEGVPTPDARFPLRKP